MSKNGVTLKPGIKVFKVIENGADQSTIYDFLLVRHFICQSYAQIKKGLVFPTHGVYIYVQCQ